MAFQLKASNSIANLAGKLIGDLRAQVRDPFVPVWIVTQTDGMNIWLKQKIAIDMGISANIRFCSPDDIVAQLHFWLLPTNKKPLERETIRWTLFDLLGKGEFTAQFPDKAAYFKNSDIRRISLADEMTDLFDQYQIYRKERLQEWNQQELAGMPATDWQEWLWRTLRSTFAGDRIDRAETMLSLKEALQDPVNQEVVLSRIPSLHVFGLAVLTPYHLELLYAVSEFMEIHLYLSNPAPNQYWLDSVTERAMARRRRKPGYALLEEGMEHPGNDLLLNMGLLVKDSFKLLFQDDKMIDIYDPDEDDAALGQQPTLLQKVKTCVLHNYSNTQRADDLPIDRSEIHDGSLVINGCFTPLREMEALYNHLVGLVDGAKDGLSPRDILVQVSDIDLYAPYINAVFGHAPYALPFTISDQTVTMENNIFSAVRALLMLDAKQMKAESVFEVLESPYVRGRFGITDVDGLREAVRQAGIIFGLEGRREDDTRYISWQHGLKRIQYGLCMSGAPLYDDGEDVLQPLDSGEGSVAMDQRVRFIHFIDVLGSALQEREHPRSIAGWAEYLRMLLGEMVFDAGDDEDEDHGAFIALLEEMSLLDETVPVSINFEVFRHSFLHRLTTEKRVRSFLGKGITFCSMVPMRSIPFRLVAMLGLDHDKFPRKGTDLSFSLIKKDGPAPGDRSVRNNDRHLFLETILSAKDVLYLSFLSHDVKSGEKTPPSSLVDELIDHVAKGMAGIVDTEELRKEWVVEHPLHGFSRVYFGAGATLRNYLREDRYRTQISVNMGPERTPEVDLSRVDIEQLVSFLQNPPKAHLQRCFHVNYFDEESLLPDHETFELGKLEEWRVKRDLLSLDPVDINRYVTERSREGVLPLHNMGKASMERLRSEMWEILEEYGKVTTALTEDIVTIGLTIDGCELVGQVGNVFGENLVEVCTSSSHYKYLLAGYARYLTLVAMGKPLSFAFITKSIPGIHRIGAGTISPADAFSRLSAFLKYMEKGLKNYLPFFPAFARKDFSMLAGDHDDFMDMYEQSMENAMDFDFKDQYLQKAVEHGLLGAGNYDELQAVVNKIMKPIQVLLPTLFPSK